MLSKSRRLNLKKDFKRIVAGRKIDSKYTKLFIQTSKSGFPKIGIALSGKVFKNAVQKNRAKRLISQAFELLYDRLSAGAEIVALPKAGITGVKSAEVFGDLEQTLKRAGLISQP